MVWVLSLRSTPLFCVKAQTFHLWVICELIIARVGCSLPLSLSLALSGCLSLKKTHSNPILVLQLQTFEHGDPTEKHHEANSYNQVTGWRIIASWTRRTTGGSSRGHGKLFLRTRTLKHLQRLRTLSFSCFIYI